MRKDRITLQIPDEDFYKTIKTSADAEGIPIWKHLKKVYSANQKDLLTILIEKFNDVKERYNNLTHEDNESSVDELMDCVWAILANTIRGRYDSKKIIKLINEHIDNGEFVADNYEGD